MASRALPRVALLGTLLIAALPLALVSCDGDGDGMGPEDSQLTVQEVQQVLERTPAAVAGYVDAYERAVQAFLGLPADGVTLNDLGGGAYDGTVDLDLDADGVREGSIAGSGTVTLDANDVPESGTVEISDISFEGGGEFSGSFTVERTGGGLETPIVQVTSGSGTFDLTNRPQSEPVSGTVITVTSVGGTIDLTFPDAPVLSGSADFEFDGGMGTLTLEPDGLGGWLLRLAGFLAGLPFELTNDSPSRGGIEVTTLTTGPGSDPNGYEVAVNGESQAIGANATEIILRLEAGDYDVELTDIASNCTLTGDNPRTLTVLRGVLTPTTFELECTAPPVGTWVLQSSGLDVGGSRLLGVSFIDANTGWAVGCCNIGTDWPVIVHTTDGMTWTRQDPVVSGLIELWDIDFTDANTGTIVGDNGTILRTVDGGATWTPQTSGTLADLIEVSFVDGQTGWALGRITTFGGGAVILSTADGGATWAADTLLGQFLDDLYFLDSNTGWAVGSEALDPLVLRTTDGGQTWTPQESIPADCFPFAVDFVDANNGWAVGDKSLGGTSVIRTSDGGRNWTDQSQNLPPTAGQAFDVSFVDALVGTVISFGIYRTEDGGATWVEEIREGVAGLNAVQMIDATTGVAVGDFDSGTQEATILRRQ